MPGNDDSEEAVDDPGWDFHPFLKSDEDDDICETCGSSWESLLHRAGVG